MSDATAGHPGVWPDGEPESVRRACDAWDRAHPLPPMPRTATARAWRPAKTTKTTENR